MEAIAVDGLRKRYGDVQALDGVSFAVAEGEVFGLLGPNGAGKSTTVRVLVTLTTPDEGTASVAGHDVRRDPGAVRRTIGVRPRRTPASTSSAPGRENLMLQGRVQGMDGRVLRARTDELLELVGIADAADRIVKTYSGGMRRRLDIALGLVHRPRVLFLDEPTTGLDPEARVAMWAEVGRLAQQESLTILLTTHYLEEADELADRLVIVSRGQVVARGTPAELKATLRGDAVQVEVASGDIDRAQALLAAAGARTREVLEGRTIVARVEERRPRSPGGAGRTRRCRVAVERCRCRVRRSTTSTSTSPAATSRSEDRARMKVQRTSDTWFHGAPPDPQPHAGADPDRPPARSSRWSGRSSTGSCSRTSRGSAASGRARTSRSSRPRSSS